VKPIVNAAVMLVALTPWSAVPCRAQSGQVPVIDLQTGLTLEGAIAEGLSAEPAMRAARLEIDAARGERRQAALRPNPDVSFDQREQVGGMDRQTSVAVDLPLDPFRRRARIDTAARIVDATEAGVVDRERLLASAIRERYGDVLVAVRRLEIMDAVLGASRRTYELLRSRAEEGAAPPLDRDVALVELRGLEGTRELAAGGVVTALTALKQLIGRPPTVELKLGASLETVVLGTASSNPTTASDGRSDVREAAAQVAVAHAKTREAAQAGKPEVSVFGVYMRMAEGFPQRGFEPSGDVVPIQGVFHNIAGGLRVSIPLFNRGQGAVLAAQARERAASEMLNARQLAVASELVSATARVEAARRAMRAYSAETRVLAQQNLEIVRETYTLGKATLFDVLNEQRRFLEFEAAYTEALAEMFSAQAALRRATGEIK
jgi:cobalt-zinc-cadmium efflux system outer membrane protein